MNTAYLGKNIEYEQDTLAIGTDSVLLAAFASPAQGRVCDLGCGAGAVMLLMALRGGSAQYTGVEIREAAAEIAGRNITRAGLDARMRVINGDLREISARLPGGSFDAAVSNPPYLPVGGSIPPDDPDARIARTEQCCTMDELCRAAAYLLRFGGRFAAVYPPERLAAFMRTMSAHGIEPKKLRFFHRSVTAPPSLVLIEGRRGGREGLTVMAPLIGDGEEFRKMGRTFGE